jgi:hypothetical protein
MASERVLKLPGNTAVKRHFMCVYGYAPTNANLLFFKFYGIKPPNKKTLDAFIKFRRLENELEKMDQKALDL